MFPKVLVAAPTASAKGYCFEEWIDNVMNFKYPNFDVRLFDNTVGDNGKYVDKCNDYYQRNFGADEQFKQITSNTSAKQPVKKRIAISHEECRQYALDNGYDYLLHLESDVFPEPDIIEQLMEKRKKVIGALFYRDHGIYRAVMLQKRIYKSPHNIKAINFEAHEDQYFVDGTVKKIASVGLGCVLIHKSVLETVNFRYDPKQDVFPDSLFSQDCFEKNITIWVDTAQVCRHENRSWALIDVKK